jgi:excisionase family DNA binding protein
MKKKSKPSTAPDCMTMDQACERLECGRSKIFELLKYGRLRRIRTGRRMRILTESVYAYERALIKESHDDAKKSAIYTATR